ncbi:RimJ/RimL family protein N-acetyltransferase [Gracilibacillus halotolerans]|uniref:RimJ/RimL family protein N-acetyltransferase n=1 Tax=Gracilibacillus halotolerans TaxID=74386 RepID=A0A841RSV4_9BACI|nr:GNAT family N-acetyltransferase [Gracilibacillus halotolerans]MBB6514396.1 RimJ/RimL family protein N-acetyltransferase [Gracilibacillus halotolerans]
MKIRKLISADADEYFSLRLEALQDSPTAFATTYEEEKNQSAEKYKLSFNNSTQATTIGAFKDSQLVGVVTLVKEQHMKLSHRVNLVAMYVKPEERGRGLGKELILTAIEYAKNLGGIEQIYLSVLATNVFAKKLYVSCGFEIFGNDKRALKFNNTYYDEELMVLFL